MTIRIFAGKDSNRNLYPYTYNTDADAFIRIVKGLWRRFNTSEDVCCAIANVQYPSADMVVLTQYGIGVIEFKFHPGIITIGDDGHWYADENLIHSGRYNNPHDQVQSYAKTILRRISPLLFSPDSSGSVKVQTSVVFTNPGVDISRVKSETIEDIKNWENFKVISSDELPEWVETLRFGINTKYIKDGRTLFDQFSIEPSKLYSVTTILLDSTEWKELYPYMPTGQPYAYLALWENSIRTSNEYPLKTEEVILGRKIDICDYGFSEKRKVSRKHVMFSRQIDGIYVEDLGSSNGTFVNGKRIRSPMKLKHNDHVTLGGPRGSDEVCELELLLETNSITETKTL